MILYGKRLAVLPHKQEEIKTSTGIYIPPAVTNTEITVADVKFVGTEDMCAKVGDTVLYKKGTGIELKYDDDTLVVINPHELVAILTKQENPT